jgi:hypothetical protein
MSENLKERDHLGDEDLGVRIILKLIVDKHLSMWIGFMCFNIHSSDVLINTVMNIGLKYGISGLCSMELVCSYHYQTFRAD